MSEVFKRVNGTLLLDTSRPALARAVAVIRSGGLVAFPTETVYGLGAAATDSDAVKKIFLAKGRPADNPLIVHLSSPGQLARVAEDIPNMAYRLAEKFWPGALSLVLKKADSIPAEVSAGLNTVAVRMPDHKIALKLINLAGVPIAAPSANRSGKPSPTSYRHVLEDLAGKIDAVIVDDGCTIGIESTVLDLSSHKPVILRPGGVSREELEDALHLKIAVSGHENPEGVPSSPGMKYRHYSPNAPLILITGNEKRCGYVAKKMALALRRKGFQVGIMNYFCGSGSNSLYKSKQIASGLYRDLRKMDLRKVDIILAQATGTTGVGLAVMNRLRKAATRIIRVY